MEAKPGTKAEQISPYKRLAIAKFSVKYRVENKTKE